MNLKKIVLGVAGIFLHSLVMAQGISFEMDKSWKEVVALAEKTGKHIFVDAYTTWCGPCIEMDRNVFPQKEVGDFYNANFINFKIQMDKTVKDSDAVKARYADAAWFEKTYTIAAYPCYLFFDPKGNLIHQAGGSRTGPEFVTLGREAIDPNQQIAHMHKLYQEGNRSGTFVLGYLQKLASANDPKMEVVADDFIAANSSPLTETAVDVMMFMTTGAESPYFLQLWKNRAEVIRIKGEEKGQRYFSRVIESGVMSKAMTISVDPATGKTNRGINENGLRAYFNQFYPAKQANLQADFNIAKYGKLFDPQLSYEKAKAIVKENGTTDLEATQIQQLANMVLRDGSNQEDVQLVLTFVKDFESASDLSMLQLFTKVYFFSGDLTKSYAYAERAMDQLKKNRPEYEKVSAEEFVKKVTAVMPTPQIVTN
ncbi:MAG: thioredoxin family protein [Sphingobacterium sp.]|jgi:thioredoxin-related protein|nr:thioredoxin family protein [Sphingobacterium sp.]